MRSIPSERDAIFDCIDSFSRVHTPLTNEIQNLKERGASRADVIKAVWTAMTKSLMDVGIYTALIIKEAANFLKELFNFSPHCCLKLVTLMTCCNFVLNHHNNNTKVTFPLFFSIILFLSTFPSLFLFFWLFLSTFPQEQRKMETLKDLKGKEFWNACSEGNLEKPKELYNQPNDVINWSNPNNLKSR